MNVDLQEDILSSDFASWISFESQSNICKNLLFIRAAQHRLKNANLEFDDLLHCGRALNKWICTRTAGH